MALKQAYVDLADGRPPDHGSAKDKPAKELDADHQALHGTDFCLACAPYFLRWGQPGLRLQQKPTPGPPHGRHPQPEPTLLALEA